MKKGLLVSVGIFILSISISFAQVQQINLDQTEGKFETESITIAEGAYQFNISNAGVDHEVGFVVVPAGNYEMDDHIKEAYVKTPVANGKSSMTSVVNLEAGEYEYFCPMNSTPKYKLTVVGGVDKIRLGQTPGTFNVKALTLAEGSYQFEIANNGVNHDVGFVLVPKGQYDQANHITHAYVSAPVANGSTSLTGIVKLAKGDYEYFCPLNPTDKFSLSVE